MTHRVIVLLVACVAFRCAHHMPQLALSEALRLETDVQEVASGPHTSIHAVFRLRNVTSNPLDLCQLDSEVTIWQQSSIGVRAIVIGGPVVDGPSCYAPAKLAPGEAREFDRTFQPWPGKGDYFIGAALRVHRVNSHDVADMKAELVPIRGPAN